MRDRGKAGFRRGRAVTLIEAVLFISIALGLIVGGLVFFQQASLSYKVSNETRVLSALVAEIQALSRQGELPLEASEYLINAGAVPSNIVLPAGTFTHGLETWVTTGARFQNSWGGPTYIWVTTTPSGDPQIQLFVYDVPIAVCARMGVTDASGNASVAKGITEFRASDYNRGGAGTFNLVPPVSPADAGARCREADQSGNRDGLVDMRWTIRPFG